MQSGLGYTFHLFFSSFFSPSLSPECRKPIYLCAVLLRTQRQKKNEIHSESPPGSCSERCWRNKSSPAASPAGFTRRAGSQRTRGSLDGPASHRPHRHALHTQPMTFVGKLQTWRSFVCVIVEAVYHARIFFF